MSGQFYDTLLKKCLQCSELCGSHPEACADACRSESEDTTHISHLTFELFNAQNHIMSMEAEVYAGVLYLLIASCMVKIIILTFLRLHLTLVTLSRILGLHLAIKTCLILHLHFTILTFFLDILRGIMITSKRLNCEIYTQSYLIVKIKSECFFSSPLW